LNYVAKTAHRNKISFAVLESNLGLDSILAGFGVKVRLKGLGVRLRVEGSGLGVGTSINRSFLNFKSTF